MYSEFLVIIHGKPIKTVPTIKKSVTGSKSKTASHKCEPKLRLSQMVTIS